MAKTIRDFVLGKIRRSELDGRVELDPPEGPCASSASHPGLGAHQGSLGEAGGPKVVDFFEHGLVLPSPEGPAVVRWTDIESIAPPLRIRLAGGRELAPALPPEVEDVAFAAIRWVGRGLLRRKLD